MSNVLAVVCLWTKQPETNPKLQVHPMWNQTRIMINQFATRTVGASRCAVTDFSPVMYRPSSLREPTPAHPTLFDRDCAPRLTRRTGGGGGGWR